MKKIFLLGAMVCALGMMTACKNGAASEDKDTTPGVDTTADCQPLFENLDYDDDGVAYIEDLEVTVEGGGKYVFDEDAPINAGEVGTALAFSYCDKVYYIPILNDGTFKFPNINDTVCITLRVWRDYSDYEINENEERVMRPFAQITRLNSSRCEYY